MIASLGIGSAAVADPPASPTSSDCTPKECITLTSQSGVPLTGTFTAYQLTGYTDVTYNSDNTAVTGLSATKVSSDIENVISTVLKDPSININVPEGVDNAAENALLQLGTNPANQGKVAAVADALAVQAAQGKLGTAITPMPNTPGGITGNQSGTTVKFNQLTQGYYLVTNNGTDSKPVILSSTIDGLTQLISKTDSQTTSQTIGSGYIKNANGVQTNPEKKMAAAGHIADTNPLADAKQSSKTANAPVTVGYTYDFELTFNVPNSLSYATFSGIDTPTGMKIEDPTTVKMAIGDTPAVNVFTAGATAPTSNTVNGLHFTLDTDSNLSFTPDPNVKPVTGTTEANTLYNMTSQFVRDNSGKRITITYSAKIVKKDAQNTFQLTVNPLHGASPAPQVVTVKTHSYSVQLHKVSAADRTKLSGAVFKIKHVINESSGEGKWLKFTKASSSTDTSDAQWTELEGTANTVDNATALTTDDNGNISLPNLGEGTYTIQETTAPNGYMGSVLPTAKLTISQNSDNHLNATVNVSGTGLYGGLVDTLTDGQYIHGDSASPAVAEQVPTFVVANINSLTQLPQTGGAGIIAIALLLAVLLIAGVGIGFAARRIGEHRLSSQK